MTPFAVWLFGAFAVALFLLAERRTKPLEERIPPPGIIAAAVLWPLLLFVAAMKILDLA